MRGLGRFGFQNQTGGTRFGHAEWHGAVVFLQQGSELCEELFRGGVIILELSRYSSGFIYNEIL